MTNVGHSPVCAWPHDRQHQLTMFQPGQQPQQQHVYVQQVSVPGAADLSHQFGGLSLQDPAFLQELQRVDTLKYQQHHGHHGEPQPVYGQQPGMLPQQQTVGPSTLPTVPMGGGSTGIKAFTD